EKPVQPAVENRFDLDAAGNDIGSKLEILDIDIGHRLQPYRLPDARSAIIPDIVGLELPVLLAARLGHVERLVLGAHHHHLLAISVKTGSDVGGKGRVTALMG